MQVFARQGDLIIHHATIKVTEELSPSVDILLAGGSSGHPHTLQGACKYKRNSDGSTLLRLDATRTLEHGRADGHKSVMMPPGDYEIRQLRVRMGGGDSNVED
jgi:hypothetical protein